MIIVTHQKSLCGGISSLFQSHNIVWMGQGSKLRNRHCHSTSISTYMHVYIIHIHAKMYMCILCITFGLNFVSDNQLYLVHIVLTHIRIWIDRNKIWAQDLYYSVEGLKFSTFQCKKKNDKVLYQKPLLKFMYTVYSQVYVYCVYPSLCILCIANSTWTEYSEQGSVVMSCYPFSYRSCCRLWQEVMESKRCCKKILTLQ